jgi:pyrroline-5-carboxylate reductase
MFPSIDMHVFDPPHGRQLVEGRPVHQSAVDSMLETVGNMHQLTPQDLDWQTALSGEGFLRFYSMAQGGYARI